jgi:O-antigen/teichoic acid export membrane protein
MSNAALHLVMSSGRARAIRVATAVMDQAVVGGTGLITVVLPGRILAVEEYAVFAVAYVGYLLFYTLHSALLSEPLLVLAAREDSPDRTPLLRFSRATNNRLTVFGVATLSTGLFLNDGTLASAIVLAFGAAVVSSVAWEERRKAYALGTPAQALKQSSSLLAFFLVGIYLALQLGERGPAMTLLPLAVAGLLTGLIARRRAASPFETRPLEPPKLPNELRQAFVRYAKSAAAVALTVWLASNIGYLALLWLGTERDVALLRAAMNLLLPFQHMTIGIGLLLTPAVARRWAHADFDLWRHAAATGLTLALAGVAYGTLLILSGPVLLQVVYDSRYPEAVRLLSWAPILAGFWGIQAALASALRAIQLPGAIFRALAAGIVIGWVAVPSVAGRFTLEVAVATITVVHGVAVILLVVALRQIHLGVRATQRKKAVVG